MFIAPSNSELINVLTMRQVILRRRATPEFSPAFQGRDQRCDSSHVAFATIESMFQLSLTRQCLVSRTDPGLERPG